MAITNSDRISRMLDLLREGIGPFAEREMASVYAKKKEEQARLFLGNDEEKMKGVIQSLDVSLLFRLFNEAWADVFKKTLGPAERSLVIELRDTRNKWAHQKSFSIDDVYRAYDSAERLLSAVSAKEAAEINKLKTEIMRLKFDEQLRSERRKTGGVIETASSSVLKPWREVVTPHQDVARGDYQQAEFAADLWQVHIGEGGPEYRDPIEFFRRTFVTQSLNELLRNAINRISAKGGDPVVQLQTNFGGGKTHSMLALYHLFSGTPLQTLPGLEGILDDMKITSLPKVKRVVMVGNKISPGNPSTKPDGTVVHTLWGEMAWQLGGKKAYKRIQADDERATNPGDVIRELLNEFGPSLVLIDEWVAYARQLHDSADLPGGSFETHFTFAQALTESAKLAKNCLLVISLPASDTAGSPHTRADDIEVGGERGRAALDRLRNAIGRVETSWRPASTEEGFEIVRRRLFEPIVTQAQYLARDSVAREFSQLYHSQSQEFPPECREPEYEKKIKAAYPIHPEVFDRLYNDWSTLVKFQRTRGVLRLMAAVIHSLWENDDRNPLIMPANISIDDSRVQFELTRYLSDNWLPIIAKDVDGPNALPLKIDREQPNLGRFHACRRVARTIYLGSAPTTEAANKGLEDRRIKLGCVMPHESPAVFGDALRRLATSATYLYQDGPRYWYSTQPTVTKLAEDRADLYKRDPDKIAREIESMLRLDTRQSGEFSRIHVMPQTSQDVPDETDCRLVLIDIDHPFHKDGDSPAEKIALQILEHRGNSPRLFRNTLIFLAADQTRLQDLDEAVRKSMAWQSILDEKLQLNLDPHQVRQAEIQKRTADSTVTVRIPETFQWVLIPVQSAPSDPVSWQSIRVSGSDALATRVVKKLRNEELLITSMAGSRLRMELDRVPLWRGSYVPIQQLAEDFAKYVYLPRLSSSTVLYKAVQDGLSLLSWQEDGFAYADGYDEQLKRYSGLRCGEQVPVSDDTQGVLVESGVAARQREQELADRQKRESVNESSGVAGSASQVGPSQPVTPNERGSTPVTQNLPKRYHGTIVLEPGGRMGRTFGEISEEIISHLAAQPGAHVAITIEINAELPGGAPEQLVRTVTENTRALKFQDGSGFERE